MTIDLLLNGEPVTLACAPHESLRTVLRRAGLHSVRFGSHTGETGAAGVLVDGVLVSADVMLAAQADGHEIETVEGLAGPREIHPLQQAFIDTGAIQSGYSTPAMILAAKALLERKANPTEEEIRDALSGVLDRETGYMRPVQAVSPGRRPQTEAGRRPVIRSTAADSDRRTAATRARGGSDPGPPAAATTASLELRRRPPPI